MEIDNTRLFCVIINARRIYPKYKALRLKNYQIVSDIFGYGTTKSVEFCLKVGLNPIGIGHKNGKTI